MDVHGVVHPDAFAANCVQLYMHGCGSVCVEDVPEMRRSSTRVMQMGDGTWVVIGHKTTMQLVSSSRQSARLHDARPVQLYTPRNVSHVRPHTRGIVVVVVPVPVDVDIDDDDTVCVVGS